MPALPSTDSLARPLRQGFYLVTLQDGTEMVAEYREHGKGAGKRWWQYVSETPLEEKKPSPLEAVVSFKKVSDAQVKEALKRALTWEEQVQHSYESFKNNDVMEGVLEAYPPECRKLQVGDELEVGNLRDCKVVALFEEGRVVTYSFRNIEHRYGREVDQGVALRTSYWIGIVKKREVTRENRVRESRLEGAFVTTGLSGVMRKLLGELTDSPDYQRGYVWSAEDQQRYLDSVFEGRDLGRFIFVKHPYPQAEELLDGKQRLNCLNLFFQSRISWRGLFWHELNKLERYQIENRSVQVATLSGSAFSRSDRLRVFLEVNAAGVPQSEEHLDHVRALLAEALAQEGRPVRS